MITLTILGTLLLLILIVVLAYGVAKNKQQATFVEQGTMEFVAAGGETLLRVLPNIKGWRYSDDYVGNREVPYKFECGELDSSTNSYKAKEETIDVKFAIVQKEIIEASKKKLGWLKNTLRLLNIKRWFRNYLRTKWGFFWVSILWPVRRVYELNIERARLRDDYPEKGARVRLREMIEREKKPAKFLLWQFPRPILVPDVEFKDRFKADIVVMTQCRVVVPQIPAFVWKEKFFQLLESSVEGSVLDYARKLTFAEFVEEKETKPGSQFFLGVISPLNRKLIELQGIHIFDGWIKDYELSAEDQKAAQALKARQIASLEGDAEIVRADKEGTAALTRAKLIAQAKIVEGTAEADVLKAKAAAGLPLAIAEQMVKGREAVRGTNLTTLVESGATAGILVDSTEKPKKKS